MMGNVCVEGGVSDAGEGGKREGINQAINITVIAGRIKERLGGWFLGLGLGDEVWIMNLIVASFS